MGLCTFALQKQMKINGVAKIILFLYQKYSDSTLHL